ncbi:PREDICTED: LOW QUALITY PROTEIN: adhesion G protein-coupled receptor F5, partial [Gekko japonicus]|uniref:LOW QUALITY PROTEIN: adhesion G protein-coupled receptor F5 n=1 Tax=Gekko japonicus TaxID=146911 RepID=A0ABM1KBI0_GEKJA
AVSVRALSAPPTSQEYTVAIEILFADSSLQNTIKSYLNNLSFPLLINASDPAGNISSIQVTTACNSTGSNSSHCYCEDGYWWPNDLCPNPAYPSITAAPEEYHNCIAQLPSQGIYCQLLPEDTGVIHLLNMTVRLDIPFQNDLRNPSSTLYKQYKRDLERAFTVGYQTLPGFISAKVTGFRNGSTVVDYEVTSARAIPVENASGRVATALNSSYKVDPTSFRSSSVEIYGGTNLSISPQPIFKGDTVTMRCESRSKSSNVTWSVGGSSISSSDRHSITSAHSDGKAVSMLKIRNVLLNESGQYSCTFTDQETSPTTMHTADGNITVSLIRIVNSEDIVMECNGEKRELSCCVDTEISFFNVHWKPDGAINISGTNDSTLNCTLYELQANESQCPADKSGNVTTYTCELSTSDGARQSKHICVKYLRKAKVTLVSSTNGQVSERANFSLTCRSDVSNYDEISWAIHSGNLVTDIDSVWYTTTKTQNGAESVLDVRQASQNWTGTYTCTFSQESLNSSAHLAMEVLPLPLKEDIVRDPIEAIIPCPGNQALKCCIPRGRMENYTVTFEVGQGPSNFWDGRREEGNSVCHIRTLSYDNCSYTGQNFSATCEFRNQIGGRVQSLPMTLKLVSTKVTLVSSTNGQVSEGANFSLTCRSDFSNYDNVRWEIQNGNPVPDIDSLWYTTTKTQNGIESVLAVRRANQNWTGTYTCTFFQESLNSSAHLAMEVLPLPLKEDIVRDPIEAIIPCPGNQALKCCIPRGRMENYTVTFEVGQGPSSFWDEKTIMCNSSDIGVGETRAEVVKPCLGNASSVRGNITYSERFQIKMTFAKMNKSLIEPRCVFWNFTFSGDRGGWDGTGCERKEDDESVTCSCNHLTSFSVLMSPAGRKNHGSHWRGLSYMTYVGVGVSILSLVACIVIEALVWKSVTKTRISYMRHVCILNVAISLLIADIWFIFFYLSVFFWMLSLSLMLFYHLVFILHNTSKTTMKAVAFCLGYGCPLVISGITIAVTLPQESYTREDICFLNWDKSYALLAMVVPALTIVAINAVITIVVIAKIPIRSIGERSRNDERSSLYRITKSIGVLTPLLGLTWGFGLATIFEGSSLVFHILFNFFNAFQGLFILLFGILWDRKVREALMNKFSLSRWSSQTSKSTVHGPSAPMFSISSPFSKTLNNLFGKAGKYQVSSMESPSSSSENTSKAYSLLT